MTICINALVFFLHFLLGINPVQKQQVVRKIDSLNNISYDAKIANTEKSIKNFNTSLQQALKIKYYQGVADCYANLGLVYYFHGKYDLNTKSMLNAIRWYEKLGDKSKLAHCYAEYGFQLKKRNIQKALYYMQKGMKIALIKNDEYELRGIYDNYGVLKEMSKDLDSALLFYNKSWQLKEKANDSIGIPYSVNKIALVKLMKKDFVEAKKLLNYAYNIRKSINDIYGISESLNLYGFYFKEKGDNKMAIQLFNVALEESKKNKYQALTQENYTYLTDLYERNADYRNALLSFKNAVAYKDTLSNINVRNKQAELDTQYDSEEKEKEILKQKVQLAEKNIWILGVSSTAVITLLLGLLLYNRQRQKTKQLKRENDLKDALLKIETQNKLQEQRLRISRDLHDNIGAQLTFIISSVENLKYSMKIQDNKLIDKLSSISVFARETINELRDTIWAMNKDEITFEDLNVRINNFIENAKIASNGVEYSFATHGDFKDVSLTSVEGINIYRVIQEAINNALKHANASKILVNVYKNEAEYRIEIQDNGKGFDEATAVLSNGLNNLRKRAKEINGTIQINSLINIGTTVKLQFNKQQNVHTNSHSR